jgi:divinyl chlorophyllide a 8-vinyl-reductase
MEAMAMTAATESSKPRRVLVLGATGTIGRATVRALLAAGHETVCFIRRPKDGSDPSSLFPAPAVLRFGDVTDPASLRGDGFAGERFDVLLSCLASRTGEPADAWAIDYQAHVQALEAARAHGVRHMILLSAICVQKPKLAFQHSKLAFEAMLMQSGLTYSIVRPTAYFKSLSGQVARVRAGKPFLVFGDGTLTACKPISDDDLGRYLALCITSPELHDKVLPVGGPGKAITPREQGEHLHRMLGREPKFRRVPVAVLDAIVILLGSLGTVVPGLRSKAELARIGRYYATESMLLWDDAAGRYDAAATPSFGTETLFDHYTRAIRGEAEDDRRDHAVF